MTLQAALRRIAEAQEKQFKTLDLSFALEDLGPLEQAQALEQAFELEHLQTLRLVGNRLQSIPRSITRLCNLIWLNLGNNPLLHLPDWLGDLPNLIELTLYSLALDELPECLTRLERLEILDLRYNSLGELPAWLPRLGHLRSLDLSDNRFSAVPEVIYDLGALEYLSFANHQPGPNRNQIKQVSHKILQLGRLQELNLDGNPVDAPPPEIIAKGVRATKSYFQQIARQGRDRIYEAGLLILGEPGAGKTTLAGKLDPAHTPHAGQDKTSGINGATWAFPMPDGKTFRVNIWDFGGQETYPAAHQLFLTRRSLYVLVADPRTKDTDLHHWLNVVELLGDGSPALIVKNEKYDRGQEIDERQLRNRFPGMEKVLATNLATNRGFLELVDELERCVTRLPRVSSTVPKTWARVREALEKHPRPTVSLDEYLAICERHGFTRREDKLQLIDYLHDLGVCQHFTDDPILSKIVILKPQWSTSAVYQLLDDADIIHNLGRFTRKDLDHIWAAPEYIDRHGELVQLMMKFGLCYQLPGSRDEYMVPQLFSGKQPDYGWEESDNLHLRYAYPFMPRGILSHLIVATHPMIEDGRHVWKNGVVLRRDDTRAEVIEHCDLREIHIRVSGLHKLELLASVQHELDRIHATYNRLQVDKLIPCNCSECNTAAEPYFYPFEILTHWLEKRRPQIMCHKSGNLVDVRPLIDAVLLPPGREQRPGDENLSPS